MKPKKPTKEEIASRAARAAARQLFKNHFREQAKLKKMYPTMEPWVLSFLGLKEWISEPSREMASRINKKLREIARRLERMKL